jgi:hypothetical protein
MHHRDKIQQFIQLRARGWSLRRISRQIGVPKSTLDIWRTKHSNEIFHQSCLAKEERDEARSALHKRQAVLTAQWLTLLHDEYARRLKTPQTLSNAELFKMAALLRAEFNEMCSAIFDSETVAQIAPPDIAAELADTTDSPDTATYKTGQSNSPDAQPPDAQPSTPR